MNTATNWTVDEIHQWLRDGMVDVQDADGGRLGKNGKLYVLWLGRGDPPWNVWCGGEAYDYCGITETSPVVLVYLPRMGSRCA